mgnify:CR=1 FL=1
MTASRHQHTRALTIQIHDGVDVQNVLWGGVWADRRHECPNLLVVQSACLAHVIPVHTFRVNDVA